MEPGPLPPHERSWRHPSELGPTRVDVDDHHQRPRANFLALGGGAMAVLAVAAMVVAMTPRTSGGPVALSATTTPITARAVVEPPANAPAEPATESPAGAGGASTPIRSQTAMLTSFAAFPHAVTPGPQFDVDGTPVADEPPAADELVFVRTEAVTYHLPWEQARLLVVPDGSVMFDSNGQLVARVRGGDVLSLVDD